MRVSKSDDIVPCKQRQLTEVTRSPSAPYKFSSSKDRLVTVFFSCSRVVAHRQQAPKMRYLSYASLLAAAAVLVSAEDPSNVLNLTPSNFASTVNKEALILVEFFAPW